MFDEIKPLFDLGYSALWLRPRSKIPIEKGWTTPGAGLDWDTFRAFYAGDNNVGVRLGANSELRDGSFLAVLDCDVKSAEPAHLAEMEKVLDSLNFNWPSAPTVVSGRGNGSRHIHIRTEAPISPFRLAQSSHLVRVHMPSVTTWSKRELEKLSREERADGWHIRAAWEISVMGTGQQVVLPPSVHPDTGSKYFWERKPKDPSDLPLLSLKKEDAVFVKPKTPIKSAPVFEEVAVDLVSSNLPEWAYNLIVHGQGLERYNNDRSAALLAVTYCLINAGFSDLEIMTVLTDPDYELSSVAYDHRKTNDRRSAAQWVFKYTVQKARHEKSAEKAFEDEAVIENVILDNPEDVEKQEEELKGDWRENLDRAGGPNGKPRPTLRNILSILKNFPEKPIFTYDEFFQEERYYTNPPWANENTGNLKGLELTDVDLGRIKVWFGQHWGFEPSENNMEHAVRVLARENVTHPVREYLDGLYWDGVKRVDGWLQRYLGAVGEEAYLQAIGRKFLCAAVARVYEPGIKWEHVLTFEGNQGIGKSTACEMLAGAWFSDSIGDITQKDAVEAMRGKWIIELGELANLTKADIEPVKAFLSRKVDNIRKAFRRKGEPFPRQCIFVGTTNKDDYLRDETGNRRTWPVETRGLDFEALPRDRDQLWAEAKELYFEGEKLFLPRDIEDIAREVQASRLEEDAFEPVIRGMLEKNEFMKVSGFTTIEAWDQMNAYNNGNTVAYKTIPTNWDMQRVGKVLRKLGYESRKVRGGSRQWFRVRPEVGSGGSGVSPGVPGLVPGLKVQ